MPSILNRVTDETSTDLSPLETAAREFRDALIADCGGRENLTHAKLALITSTTGSWIIVSTIDAYMLDLAQREGLVSRKHRKTWPVVETRARLAESFARQLSLIGLEKTAPRTQSLDSYISEKYGSKPTTTNGSEPAA